MKEKEKAMELVQDMYNVNVSNISEFGMEWEMAKQCALISVNEILNNCIKDIADVYYWKEVKEEIIKL